MSTERAAYLAWRDNPRFDAGTRAELAAIADQPEEIRARFATALTFGTAGLRGPMRAGTNGVNVYTIARVTQALALYLLQKNPDRAPTVAIGHDTRRHSQDFARTAARVLAAHGIRVRRFPQYVPTPLLAFAVRHLACDAGIMITASHNPPADNGYKVYFADGVQISPQDADHVWHIMRDDARCGYDRLRYADYADAVARGQIVERTADVEDAYVAGVLAMAAHITADVPPGTAGAGLDILFTPLSGTAGHLALRLLRQGGFPHVRIVEAQQAPDPDFATLSTLNPEFRAAFACAEEQALRDGADLVLATDPDGDRFAALIAKPDGSYHHLSGNQTGALLTAFVLESLRAAERLPARPALVQTIVTDRLAAAIARDAGAYVHETLTGFKYICGDIPQLTARGYDYILGFEESIGYAIGTLVRDKDGLSAALLLCHAAAHCRRQQRTLWDMLTRLWMTYGYHAARPLNLVREGSDGQARIAAILAAFRARAPRHIGPARLVRAEDLATGYAQTYLPDGTAAAPPEPLPFPRAEVLRFFFDDHSWYAVRPSGTEPKLKIYMYTVIPPTVPHEGSVGHPIADLQAQGERALDRMHDALRPLLTSRR